MLTTVKTPITYFLWIIALQKHLKVTKVLEFPLISFVTFHPVYFDYTLNIFSLTGKIIKLRPTLS